MTLQTCIWCPPSCCGCKLEITGDFDPSQVHDGVSYRHPTPFTITALKIISVCAGHRPNTLSMIDASVLFGGDRNDDAPADSNAYLSQKYPKLFAPSSMDIQFRGYLKHPIENPTPAECLYTFLGLFSGTKHTLPCGCSGFIFSDEENYEDAARSVKGVERNKTYVEHPQHTKRCAYHHDDTVDMKNAVADHKEYQAKLIATQAALNADEVTP